MAEKVNVALAQISCKVGDKKHNINVMKKNIKRAKEKGANLIIFPELSLTGYLPRPRIRVGGIHSKLFHSFLRGDSKKREHTHSFWNAGKKQEGTRRPLQYCGFVGS